MNDSSIHKEQFRESFKEVQRWHILTMIFDDKITRARGGSGNGVAMLWDNMSLRIDMAVGNGAGGDESENVHQKSIPKTLSWWWLHYILIVLLFLLLDRIKYSHTHPSHQPDSATLLLSHTQPKRFLLIVLRKTFYSTSWILFRMKMRGETFKNPEPNGKGVLSAKGSRDVD